VEGSGWKLNEGRHEAERKRREGGEGQKSNAGNSAARNRRWTNQGRKGKGKGELRKHAGSSGSEHKLRGGEYIHDHRDSILNTRRSVLYTWQPEDIAAE
jgi:hypothetical protein